MCKCGKSKCGCGKPQPTTVMLSPLPDAGKIWLNTQLKGFDETLVIAFDSDDWNVAFNKFYQSVADVQLLTDNHALEISANSKFVYTIKVYVQTSVSWFNLQDQTPTYSIILRKNGDVVSYTTFRPPFSEVFPMLNTISIEDILLLEAGDNIDIGFYIEATNTVFSIDPSYTGTTLWGEENQLNGISYATFEVIGKDKTGDSTVAPPSVP